MVPCLKLLSVALYSVQAYLRSTRNCLDAFVLTSIYGSFVFSGFKMIKSQKSCSSCFWNSEIPICHSEWQKPPLYLFDCLSRDKVRFVAWTQLFLPCGPSESWEFFGSSPRCNYSPRSKQWRCCVVEVVAAILIHVRLKDSISLI